LKAGESAVSSEFLKGAWLDSWKAAEMADLKGARSAALRAASWAQLKVVPKAGYLAGARADH
jgi:hypothetical protein